MLVQNNSVLSFLPGWLLVLSGFAIAFVISYVTIPPILAVSNAKKLYDMPNGRTSHKLPTPLLGGIAVFAGTVLAIILAAGCSFGYELRYIFAGILILFFTGIKDDLLIIAPAKKLFAEIASALIIIMMGDIRITSFYGIFGINEIPYIGSVLFTLFVFIVIINSFNLIDGIDGLSAGVGVITSLAFGIWFMVAGYQSYTVLCFALAGSLLAFLRFNLFSEKNKIFLGDTGSLILGSFMATIAVRFIQFEITATGIADIHSTPAIACGILIYPLFDTLRVFTIRILRGQHPFKADKSHIHHLMLKAGFTHLESTLYISLANIFIIGISFMLNSIGILLLSLVLLLISISLTGVVLILIKRKKMKNSVIELVSQKKLRAL